MSHCLNCSHWQRLEDGIVGKCHKRELPEESYRFQFERCRLYQEGEQRKPFIEQGYAKRVRDYSNVTISPELESQVAELLKQGVPVVEARNRLKIGAQVMSAVVRRHRAEYEIGAEIRKQTRLDPLDAYADEFKRLLDAGASFYKVQMVTGVNRARVSAYVQRKGWEVAK
jgi:hypothetical protein